MTDKKTPVNYLDLVPVALFGHERMKDGRVHILVPRFTSKVFARLLMPILKNKFIPLKLDELGSATYLEIDGKRTVQQICDRLTASMGERIHPAEERVTAFLNHLYKGKIIQIHNPNNSTTI